MRRLSILVSVGVLAVWGDATAQSIVSPSRTIDFRGAGANVVIRSTVCANLSAGASAAQINSAIAACPSGQVVFLNAGTYNLSTGIIFADKSNVTLRGAGPDKTFLNFTNGNNCGGVEGNICLVNGASNYADGPENTANWTSGYAQGATTITLSNTTNLRVGTLLVLDQLSDGTTDTGDVFVCTTAPCTQSEFFPGRPNRPQQQIVTVTAISGTTVSFTPGLYMPNWRAARSPGAWWSSDTPVTGVGVEDLSINGSSSGTAHNVSFYLAQNSWLKNVRSIKPGAKHVRWYLASHNTVRDSYFFDTQTSTNDAYGISSVESCDSLGENNIFQSIPNPIQHETGCGHVYAYNYSVNNDFGGPSNDWAQCSDCNHTAGTNYILFESNDGFGMTLENYFGQAHFVTAFRNRYTGYQSGKASQTVPIHIYHYNRYENVIGNVLGTNGYHNTYQVDPTNFQSATQCNHAIFALGFGGNCEPHSDDPSRKTMSTLMRWGNYDTATATTRFQASEVPSGIGLYANPVPSTQTLPASLMYSSKPSFFGSAPWPAIGPDVTGGSEPGVGGHNQKIPARRCFEDVMGGTFSDTSARSFNALLCYGDVIPTTPTTAPAAPSGLRIVR
jgi:hypothetical protein